MRAAPVTPRPPPGPYPYSALQNAINNYAALSSASLPIWRTHQPTEEDDRPFPPPVSTDDPASLWLNFSGPTAELTTGSSAPSRVVQVVIEEAPPQAAPQAPQRWYHSALPFFATAGSVCAIAAGILSTLPVGPAVQAASSNVAIGCAIASASSVGISMVETAVKAARFGCQAMDKGFITKTLKGAFLPAIVPLQLIHEFMSRPT